MANPRPTQLVGRLARCDKNLRGNVTEESEAQASSLQRKANLADLTNVPVARDNLGLGSAATEDITAFDPAGAAAAAQAAAEAASLPLHGKADSAIDADYATVAGSTIGTGKLEATFAAPTTVVPLGHLTTHAKAFYVVIVIDTPFSPGARISVGDALNQESLVALLDVDTQTPDSYAVEPNFEYGADTPINLYITGLPTTGSGVVTVFYL